MKEYVLVTITHSCHEQNLVIVESTEQLFDTNLLLDWYAKEYNYPRAKLTGYRLQMITYSKAENSLYS